MIRFVLVVDEDGRFDLVQVDQDVANELVLDLKNVEDGSEPSVGDAVFEAEVWVVSLLDYRAVCAVRFLSMLAS